MAKKSKNKNGPQKRSESSNHRVLWAIAKVLLAILIAASGTWIGGILLWPEKDSNIGTVITDHNSISQFGVGENLNQTMKVDISRLLVDGAYINAGARVSVNITNNYQGGLDQVAAGQVRSLYLEGRALVMKNDPNGAIEKFRICLDLEEDAKRHGALNLQIGDCYYKLRQYGKAEEFYSAGLREARKAVDSEGIASNQLNIGNTYLARPSCDGLERQRNVEEALRYYDEAHKVFTKQEYPSKYAETHKHMGKAYLALPSANTEKKGENLVAAVKCFEDANDVYTKEGYPLEYADVQTYLGQTYLLMGDVMPKKQRESQQKACESLGNALRVYRKNEYPYDYGCARNIMGWLYTEQGKSEDALKCFEDANEIFSRKKDYLLEYAATQNNLGATYETFPSATPNQKTENKRKSLKCYREALAIYRKDEYPEVYCLVSANLGELLMSLGDPNAYYWYKEAYALREYLPNQGKSLEGVIKAHDRQKAK